MFKQQLLRALEDPEVAAAIERAATPESDGELPDALDYQGRPLLDNVANRTAVAVASADGETATPVAVAAGSPAAEATVKLGPRSPKERGPHLHLVTPIRHSR